VIGSLHYHWQDNAAESAVESAILARGCDQHLAFVHDADDERERLGE
jgi:hypothetical protein